MNIIPKNWTWLFLKPWLGVSFGAWITISVVYYWWLISRISVLENQNRVIKAHLKMSQSASVKASVDNVMSYQVPIIPDASGTVCETIHIAQVCMGKCTRVITPMLKSILHHRQNPLHFHFIVDPTSEEIMTKLFDTWNLPDVQYTCYNGRKYISKVEWIPNSHYSGVFAAIKLLVPEMLPNTLNRVIVLDSDLTFLSDVAELWNMFSNMTDEQFIGLVENESNWYLEAKRWPALGRGFNAGLMLLDLQKLRDNNWNQLWQGTLYDNLETHKQLALADQDVINAVIKTHPNVVFNISCQYNVQMSVKSLAKNCYGEDVANVKIVHWNSPQKLSVNLKDAPYFRSIHQSYVNFDGNLFSEKLHRCSLTEVVTYKMDHSDLCLTFRAAQRMKFRTHLYYMDYSYKNTDNFDVTLVMQLSMDRLQFLERLVEHWEGPISASIYLSDCDVPQFERFIKDSSASMSMRTNIGYHLVFKQIDVHYPVNYLRNVALEHVSTPYVFLMDVDFVPMEGLYQHLRKAIALVNPYPQKKCLVVAAFETQRYRGSPPSSKKALLSRLKTGDVAPFRAREWPRGHRATNYTLWAKASKPYEVEWQSDYEPYLVVHRSVPHYDTRFSGFGWNKVSHGVELRARGYTAVVLPDAFVVHTPHAPSADITAFRTDPHYRVCLSLLKQEFMEDLKRKYNVTLDETKPETPYIEQSKSLLLNQHRESPVDG